VAKILGELVVVSAATAGAFKFRGTLSLQTSSDGPVPLLIAEYRAQETEDPNGAAAALRGYARFDVNKIAALAASDVTQSPVSQLLGKGHLAITLDPGAGGERYQGVTALDGSTLVDCVHAYFRQSEQLDAALRVDVSRPGGVDQPWRASGVMIQRLPKPGAPYLERDNDAWSRALTAVGSMDQADLLSPIVPRTTVLERLFPEDNVRTYRPVQVESRCRCSRHRVDAVLQSFTLQDQTNMVVDGQITVTCEFCNRSYGFSLEELGRSNRGESE
jgi:molecular chaperone Hsp33